MKTKKMNTLIFLDYFTPAFKAGGPIRIFEAVARDCAEASVGIVAQDHDWGDSQPLKGITSDSWSNFLNVDAFYASSAFRTARKIIDLITSSKCHQIHLNSLFSRTWTLKILLLKRVGFFKGIKIFLSPHGELAASALGQKRARKAVFLNGARSFGLLNEISWIATSAKEVDEIRLNFPGSKVIHLLPPPLPQVYPHAPTTKSVGKIRIVFFARLSAMKNIGFLLKVIPMVSGKIELDIYGPVDPDFESEWKGILAKFETFDSDHKVNYLGPLPSSKSAETLASYDLFVQPSLTENFGFSIVEALASGTPVLLSDRTPWNCVNNEQIGAALPLEREQDWVEFLDRFSKFDSDEWQKWSDRAQLWIKKNASSTERLLEIYSTNFSLS